MDGLCQEFLILPRLPTQTAQVSAEVDVVGYTRASEHWGCGYWSEAGGTWRADGMSLGGLTLDPDTGSVAIRCVTYHLSAFASRGDSTTPQWSTADLFTDISMLAKVRRTVQDSCHALQVCSHG